MEPRDIKTLLLLEAIDKEECQSQRELSKKLNISLGLVNAIIKRLSTRGYFKVDIFSKSKAKYILTPKGISEKSNLSIRYISYLTNFYKETKKRLQLRFDELYEDGIRKIVIYGANELSEIACTLINKNYQEVVAIIDNRKEGQRLNGVIICSENELEKVSYDAVVITETENQIKAKERLIDVCVPAHKIVSLF